MLSIVPATTTTIAFLDGANAKDLPETPPPNLVAMPSLATLSGNAYVDAVAAVAELCASRSAFFIIDPPADWTSVDDVVNGLDRVASAVRENGAIYWPPLANGVSLSRAVAAVYVATDESRGVWKAPAGTTAVLDATPVYQLSDAENGLLNPLGVNCIRTFPVIGTVVWGARTLAGADALDSDWKYLNVRRLALFIESSITQSLDWTKFEPNAPPLWSSITVTVTAFLQGLFAQGAFAGAATAKDSYFVQCDASTTTPDDIQNGIVNVVVGFAPVFPAEFVILSIQALAGTAS